MSDEVTQEAAQLAADQHEQIRSFAQSLAPASKDDTSCVIKGVVTAVDIAGTPPTFSAYISGDTTAAVPGIRFLDSYTPVVGDTVIILKQGSNIFAVGQMNDTSSGSANGWVTPTLSSGFTNSTDPIKYRIINQAGDLKIQLRGSCTLSGVSYSSNLATVFTLPAGSRPLTNRSMIVPRDAGGLCIKVNFLTTGVVQIDNLIGVGTNAVQHGNLDTTGVDMQHFHDDNPAGGATGFAKYGIWPGSYTNGFPGGNPHFHITESATHSHSFTNLPTSMWLTGIELFLV